MRAQDHRTRLGPRYVVLISLVGLTGVLVSRLLFPVVFERRGPFLSLVFAIVLIARLLRSGGSRP